MKTNFAWYIRLFIWVFVFGGLVAPQFVQGADASSFEAKRAALPARLDALRERMDQGGGQDVSLALLLASRSKDARLVCSTILVYQEYPRERKLAVLLAAAVRYNERLETLQGVKDETLKRALLQAPAELEEMEGLFAAVSELENMSAPQFKNAVDNARKALKGAELARTAVVRQVQHRLNQTSQADRD